MVSRFAIKIITLYQKTFSPDHGAWRGVLFGGCRFHPTCSYYAQEAIKEYGLLKGGWLAFRRFIRCHPLGGFGYDPLPRRRGHQ